MSLREYQKKRNFQRSREPAGRVHAGRQARQPFFVVQKHDATRLHYDFRLELEGVLKSWAVPKGFPTRRGDRRLAIQVEDHPLEYSDFEGIIPEGNYGAGTVMVWDRGAYEVAGEDPGRALEQGKLHLTLHGKKLDGDWTLVRMRSSEDKPQWLLFKSGDDIPELSERAESRSVLTGRTMPEIALAADRQWESNRGSGQRKEIPFTQSRSQRFHAKKTSGGAGRAKAAAAKPAVGLTRSKKLSPALLEIQQLRLPSARPGFIEPMKALLVNKLPRGPEWIYEIKFDGVRALAEKTSEGVSLTSRTGKDMGLKYAPIAAALRALPAEQALLDGEIVALDAQGRSSFQLLQSLESNPGETATLAYYVFDLLSWAGKDCTGLDLCRRKAAAEALVQACGSPVVRFSSGLRADPERLEREMRARGLEGLVAKRVHSKYQAGRRSGDWVKFKWTNEQEFVIGGYTEPQGSRKHFGALLVGYYEGNRLLFAGKVGTGFDEKMLASLSARFQKLARPSCPFADMSARARAGTGLGPSEMRRCTWVEPRLVGQVRFAEWTRDARLRQPSFLGLREDKNPRQVVRELPRPLERQS